MRRLFFILIVLALLGAVGGALWGYRELRQPVIHQNSTTYVEIARGASVEQIISILQDHGVIKYKLPVLTYLRLTGGGEKLKAGQYTFPSPITPLEVLGKLEEGQQRLSRFTVIEGWTRWDIAEAMARLPELKVTAKQALALMNETAEIREMDPLANNLEGYLYPDTYSFPPNTTPQRMIGLMVERFKKVWQSAAPAASVPNRELTIRELVTIASLIETEAKLKDERPLIASVIYNRLDKNMNLGVDSSIVYAAKLAGKWRNDGKIYQSHLDLVSPYNTRKNAGLPPGPVGSPGAASLAAARQPAATDYLYYVREPSRADGAHNFYADENSFGKGVQALRDWERQRDARELSQANANRSAINQ